MSEHASGPWSVYRGRLHDNVFRDGRTVCAGEDASRHAVAYCDYLWPERAEANARLIAAAPDMLAALLNVRKLISEAAMTGFNWKDGDWADRLFASQHVTSTAITKATRGVDEQRDS